MRGAVIRSRPSVRSGGRPPFLGGGPDGKRVREGGGECEEDVLKGGGVCGVLWFLGSIVHDWFLGSIVHD